MNLQIKAQRIGFTSTLEFMQLTRVFEWWLAVEKERGSPEYLISLFTVACPKSKINTVSIQKLPPGQAVA